MLRFLFGEKRDTGVEALYGLAVGQARQPIFYRRFGVPDTLDGRFDLIVFHLVPLIDRLRDEGGSITPRGQKLFDTFLNDMDGNLRTIGVGDLTVPKRMAKMGEAFYGRFDAYRRAADGPALAHAAARNVLGDETRAGSAEARALGAYGLAVRAAALASADLFAGFAYPDPEPFAPVADQGAAA